MSIYRCLKNFKTIEGKNYYYGNEISSYVYNQLDKLDKVNFRLKDEETYLKKDDYAASPSILDTFISPPISDGGSSYEDNSSQSDNSSNDNFDGFGGGDSGGGGSTDSW